MLKRLYSNSKSRSYEIVNKSFEYQDELLSVRVPTDSYNKFRVMVISEKGSISTKTLLSADDKDYYGFEGNFRSGKEYSYKGDITVPFFKVWIKNNNNNEPQNIRVIAVLRK